MAIYGNIENLDAVILGEITAEPIHIKGEDGRGVESAQINSSGHLIITYSDGTTEDAGIARDGGNYLPLSGGRMTGDIVFGDQLQKGIEFEDVSAVITDDGSDVAVMHDEDTYANLSVADPELGQHAATKNYTDSAIASSKLIVHYDADTQTADATYAQILAAYNAGKTVELHTGSLENGVEMIFTGIRLLEDISGDTLIEFGGYADATLLGLLASFTVSPDDTWEGGIFSVGTGVSSTATARDIPSADAVYNVIGRGTLTIKQGGEVKGTFSANATGDTEVELDASGAAEKPYVSLERLGDYVYRATFATIPEYTGGGVIPPAGCSSYVKDGKLYRNLDWNYDEGASFHLVCPGFEAMSFAAGLTDTELDDDMIGQLPYRLVDGRNSHGIMVATHVLYNDWDQTGSGDIPLTMLPYLALTRVKSMETIEDDLDGILDNMYVPAAMAAMEYLIQVLVTDGTTTYVLRPGSAPDGTYEAIDITENAKLANFRWVADATVERSELQARPTGVERWNMMPCPLEELRFTKAYEEPTRLSEFIGIDDTDKDSTDAELTAIYNRAHAAYLDRSRDGALWQTMHSVVYGSEGMEHLWVQEDWAKDYIAATGETGGGFVISDTPPEDTTKLWINTNATSDLDTLANGIIDLIGGA